MQMNQVIPLPQVLLMVASLVKEAKATKEEEKGVKMVRNLRRSQGRLPVTAELPCTYSLITRETPATISNLGNVPLNKESVSGYTSFYQSM